MFIRNMTMVNDNLKQVIIDIFDQSFKNTLEDSQKNTHWSFNTHTEFPENSGSSQFIMLTISSQIFRALIIISFNKDQHSEKFVSDVFNMPHSELNSEKYYDYLCEVGNIFCGMLKRELGKYFPNLGMSTPNLLDRQAIKFIDHNRTDIISHISSTYENSPLLFGSLYFISYDDIDVNTYSMNAETTQSGDLELF